MLFRSAIGVLLILGIFFTNPLSTWEFWIGLIIGIGSVVLVARRGSRIRLGRSSSRRQRAGRHHDEHDDETLHGE